MNTVILVAGFNDSNKMDCDIKQKWIKLISVLSEKFQPTKLIVLLTISTPFFHMSSKINAMNLALREALCHFHSTYGQSIFCPDINMAPCHDQMFIDAFFCARSHSYIHRWLQCFGKYYALLYPYFLYETPADLHLHERLLVFVGLRFKVISYCFF